MQLITHLADVTFPYSRLYPSKLKLVLDSATLNGCNAELT